MSTENESKSDEAEVKFGSSFGECEDENSVSVEKEKFSEVLRQNFEEVDSVTIIFSNSESNISLVYSGLEADDVMLLLNIKSEDGELQAGVLTKENASNSI